MLWLEVDMYYPHSLRQIKGSTTTPICTGEKTSAASPRYRPGLQDVAID